MKKLVLICLVLLSLLIVLPTLAYAPGDTVTVDVSVNSKDANFAVLTYTYDTAVLAYDSASCSTGQASAGKFSLASDNVLNGKVGTITFKVLDDAKEGTYEIAISASDVFASGEGDDEPVATLTASVSPSSISVESSASEPENPDKPDDPKPDDPADPGEDEPCAHEKTVEKVVKEAKCEEAGEKQLVCGKCGEVVKTEEIPALSHDFKWKTVKEATAEAEGLRQSVCSRCGKVVK